MGTFTRPNALYDIFTSNKLDDRLFGGNSVETGALAGPVGSFTQDNVFVPSPESLRLINSIQAKEGKNIDVKPFPTADESFPHSAYGVFFSQSPEGGSTDPKKRSVYLDPLKQDNNIFVLSHELGHAFDPNLNPASTAYDSSRPARINSLITNSDRRNPVGFLNTYILGPEASMRAETEAQRAGVQSLRDIGYPTKQITSDPYYKGYPSTYIDTGIDQAASLYSLPTNVPQGAPLRMMDANRERLFGSKGGGGAYTTVYRPALGPDDPELNFSDAFVRNLLDLSLNKRYQEAVQSIRNRNRAYINSALGE